MNSISSVEAPGVAKNKATEHATALPSGDSPPDSVALPQFDSPEAQQLDRNLLGMKGCSIFTPQQIEHFQNAFEAMPKEGDNFLGFHLISEIGRGTFGRVFRASQSELANRLVALKISPDVGGESNKLARLQHTNIVPIHSVYLKGDLQALCMPYVGSNTLSKLITELRWHRLGSTEPLPLVREFFTSRGLDEIEGILTVVSKLAEGLAHAHGRKILHCDLKPANVLLSDDGEPMLLDFNLAINALHVTNAAFVGTFPYMSPEQLLRYFDEGPGIDERSDLYSLGVILFEMLTGDDRFETPMLPTIDEQVRQMIVDRHAPVPAVKDWNPKVPPSVQSILDKLLAPDPNDRYQSANELREDLQRQIRRRRLKFAPDPSWREAWLRFRYRNPRLTSVVSLSLMTVALIVLLWMGLNARMKDLARAQAIVSARQFQDDRREVAFLLTGQTASNRAESGILKSEEVLSRFKPELIDLLPEADRPLAREGIAEVLYLQAVGHKLKAKQASPELKQIELRNAESLLDRVGAMSEELKLRRAVLTLQADLERIRGNEKEAIRLEQLVAELPPQSSHDLYLTAVAAFERNEDSNTIALLEQSLRDDPTNVHTWSMLGSYHERRGEAKEAAAVFSTCIALRPQFFAGHYSRGMAYFNLKEYAKARLDLTEAIRLKTDFPDAYLNRSLVLMALAEPTDALSDLNWVIELEPQRSRAYLLRSRVKFFLKDEEGAESDRKQGLELTPVEPLDWVTRGDARLPENPLGAVADYEEALRLDPRYLPALMNKANALIEYLKRPDEAITVLTEAITRFPDYGRAYAGRGIQLARQGRRKEAIRDAEAMIALDNSPMNCYVLAGIYSQTSRQEPNDAQEAFRLLGSALHGGFGFEHLEKDSDLDPIRSDPRFERTIREAREQRSNEPKP